MKCPTCGSDAKGKFCAECGTALSAGACASCKAPLTPAARFCTQCGTAVKGRSTSTNPAWYLAGAAIIVLIIAIVAPGLRGKTTPVASPPATETGTAPFAGSGTGTPPPLSDNMRENADRLFNRVMQAKENNDSAQVRQFAPMAIMAYQNSGVLDDDGRYHLSLLQTASGDAAGGRASAEEILRKNAGHLLALSAAGDAARALNDLAAARGYYERLIAAYSAEASKPLVEYQDHQQILPKIRDEAAAFLKR